jgi:hypothetical protein
MTTRQERREAVAGELAQPTTESSQWFSRQYLEWCVENALPALPEPGSDFTGEQVLAMHLHSMMEARDWKRDFCAAACASVVGYYAANGHSNPRGQLVSAWLDARGRETGSRTEAPVDALTMTEIREAAERALTPKATVVGLRALVALAGAFEDNGIDCNPLTTDGFRVVASLDARAFAVTATEVRVTADVGRVVIDRVRTPDHYAAVVDWLGLGGNAPDLVAGTKAKDTVRVLRRVLHRIDGTLPCTPGALPSQVAATPESAAGWWEAASLEQRGTLMLHVDGHVGQQVQEAAVLLVAPLNLLRAAEVARLTIGHMRLEEDGGYSFTLLEHKGTEMAQRTGGKAEPKHGYVGHVRDDDEACRLACPACVLALHLRIRRDLGGTGADPLFVGYRGQAKNQVLGLQGVSGIMKRAMQEETRPDGGKRRVSSRSARVTGATELRAAGASYAEIQEAGAWQDSGTAQLYVRRHVAFDEVHLTMPLAAPNADCS